MNDYLPGFERNKFLKSWKLALSYYKLWDTHLHTILPSPACTRLGSPSRVRAPSQEMLLEARDSFFLGDLKRWYQSCPTVNVKIMLTCPLSSCLLTQLKSHVILTLTLGSLYWSESWRFGCRLKTVSIIFLLGQSENTEIQIKMLLKQFFFCKDHAHL